MGDPGNALPTAIRPVVAAVGTGLLGLIHIVVTRLVNDGDTPRGFLSLAGGISVSYVFVHLLPQIVHAGDTLQEADLVVRLTEKHIFVVTLLGFTAYYGFEQLVNQSDRSGTISRELYRFHLLAFGLYNALFGYLLVERNASDIVTMGTFVVTIGLHLLVTDYGLVDRHTDLYRHRGRWLLATALVCGALLASLTADRRVFVDVSSAFLGGGIVLNVIKEELPSEQQHLGAFLVGVVGYTVLVLLAG